MSDGGFKADGLMVLFDVKKRGNLKLSAGWVWALGKTFHSGYLNIPANLFFSHNNDGWYTGVSVGFNIAKKEQ